MVPLSLCCVYAVNVTQTKCTLLYFSKVYFQLNQSNSLTLWVPVRSTFAFSPLSMYGVYLHMSDSRNFAKGLVTICPQHGVYKDIFGKSTESSVLFLRSAILTQNVSEPISFNSGFERYCQFCLDSAKCKLAPNSVRCVKKSC